MHFSTAIATFALFAATASASVTPAIPSVFRRQLPNCAGDCIAHPNTGGCSASDDTCLCNNSVFVQSTFQCIQAACQGEDLANAIKAAADLCLAVHVTLVSAAGAEFSATASGLSSASNTAPASASTPTSPSGANTASTPSASTTPPPNAALSLSAANSGLMGLAAVGVLALVL
ncbi:hypothetical protein FB45DRAFT_1059116 [Roridomyces roridus]|uniref:CFEM domain-containing protein n=1 Tax=Roridomyces roridus TaxID=1738132 RepID=A0AAD7BQW8_9AGAR|nr:hypothetical protein FB45DRAFT_1059116 [Roridomyces roridus]